MTSEEFDEILERTNAVICNREWYERAIKALEQEPCEDCISRKAVMALAKEECETAIIPYKRFVKGVNSLPPVTPKPKIGHWIEKDGFDGDTYYSCSECGESWTTIEGTPWNNGMEYCPNCGAKMESEVPT